MTQLPAVEPSAALLLLAALAVAAAACAAALPETDDIALQPPAINTDPGPQYADEARDMNMVIGMDRTPGGRLWAAWVSGGDSELAYFVLATSDDGGDTWSKPRLVIDPMVRRPVAPFSPSSFFCCSPAADGGRRLRRGRRGRPRCPSSRRRPSPTLPPR